MASAAGVQLPFGVCGQNSPTLRYYIDFDYSSIDHGAVGHQIGPNAAFSGFDGLDWSKINFFAGKPVNQRQKSNGTGETNRSYTPLNAERPIVIYADGKAVNCTDLKGNCAIL